MYGNVAPGARSAVAGLALAGLLGIPGLPGLTHGRHQSHSIDWHSMGRTWEHDGTLRRGCHDYRYHYRVQPPSRRWSLETFLVGPGGKALASDVALAGGDPRRGTKHWSQICRSNTRPGRFTIRAKLSYDDSSGNGHHGWLSPSHFRLHG